MNKIERKEFIKEIVIGVKQEKRKKMDYANENISRWRSRNKIKEKAHSKVFIALRSGKLVRKPCRDCGAIKVEGHHEDYSRPLDVIWLCKKHHINADIIRRKSYAH